MYDKGLCSLNHLQDGQPFTENRLHHCFPVNRLSHSGTGLAGVGTLA